MKTRVACTLLLLFHLLIHPAVHGALAVGASRSGIHNLSTSHSQESVRDDDGLCVACYEGGRAIPSPTAQVLAAPELSAQLPLDSPLFLLSLPQCSLVLPRAPPLA